jgi:hypothetical protein
MRNAQKILVKNSEEKRSPGRPKCRRENIKMDLRKYGGRPRAQVVRCQLLTTADQDYPQGSPCEICGGQRFFSKSFSEYGNEPLGLTEGQEFLTKQMAALKEGLCFMELLVSLLCIFIIM